MLRCLVCLACKFLPCFHCQTFRMDDIFGVIDLVQNVQGSLQWIPTCVDNSVSFVVHGGGFGRRDSPFDIWA